MIQTIKSAVQSAIREELKEMKESIRKMTELTERNESRILTLENENDSKTTRIDELEKSLNMQNELITKLQHKSNEAEQYSRRNCVRLFGVHETKGENTDDVMIRVAKDKLGVELRVEDIDRSHRTGAVGKENGNINSEHGSQSTSRVPTSTTTSSSTSQSWSSVVAGSQNTRTSRPRPIIIKFASYRARQSVLRARRRLKGSGITLAEDLTKENYDILRKARSSPRATSAWSQDGRIFVALPATNGKTVKKVIKSLDEATNL